MDVSDEGGVSSVLATAGEEDDGAGICSGTAGICASYACRSGVRTVSPSNSSVTLIWQDRREFGRTS
jgi:hypothetical protein